MLDSQTVAEAVHEEARALVLRALPEAGEPGSEAPARRPLPSVDAIAHVLEETFYASLLTEERRPCRPRLLYGAVAPRDRSAHLFATPVPLTRESLRKLTPVHGRTAHLVWSETTAGPGILAITVPTEAPQLSLPAEAPLDLVITAPAPGHLCIDWSGTRLVSVRGGRMHRTSTCRLPVPSTALQPIGKMFGRFESTFFGHTLRAIREHGHGGAVWMPPADANLDVIQIGHTLAPSEDDVFRRADRSEWVRSIADLASVDGAVLVDSRGRLLGFGAFIDLGGPVEVAFVREDGSHEPMTSAMLGGGRHRSAAAFCHRYAPAAAVVVSEDGRTSAMMCQATPGPVIVYELSPVGEISGA